MAELNMKAHKAIWVTFFVGLIAYSGLGFAMPGMLQIEPEVLPTIAMIQAVLAILAGGASYLLWRRRNAPGNTAQQIHTFSILTWASDEFIGLLGLVLALAGADFASWLLFVIAGLVLLLIHRPRGDEGDTQT